MTNNFSSENLKRIRRSSSDRMLAGVCGGIAEHFGIQSIIVRIALIATAFLMFALPVFLYAVAWLMIPEEDRI